MKKRTLSIARCGLSCIGLLAIFGPMNAVLRAQGVPPPPLPAGAEAAGPAVAAEADPNIEVMTRGPVHEAFATPVTAGQTTGLIVPKQPAAPVEEVPPEMKPEGENSVWIPGYWSWDDDRKDFIWVSGVWRVPPPGYRWMPGYWQDVPGQGYQWVTGYWMPAQMEETTFMPQPPATLEAGPTSEAPAANHFWVPGNWQWHETRYAWQPGYWSQCQPDWIWVPATYTWCPRGWVYVPGYWDYPLARRGLVFSPVYFSRPVAVYRPAVCLDVGVFSFSLFCRPSYGHYYFGDYYDARYVGMGIRPWFYYSSARHGYDPLYGYYRWYHVDHLGERQWDKHLAGWHDYYRSHPDMRPPHTLAAQQALFANHAAQSRPDFQQLHMAQNIHQLSRKPEAFVKLQPVSQTQAAQLRQAAKETYRFENERRQFEHKPIAGGPGVAAGGFHGPAQPEKVNLSKIPSFKSTQLPGAAASNVNPLLGRPAGGTPGSTTAGGQPTLPGRPDRRTPGNPAVTGNPNPGTTTGGTTNPAGRPGFRPGTTVPGGNPSAGTVPSGPSNPAAGTTTKPAGGPPVVNPGAGTPGRVINPGAGNPSAGPGAGTPSRGNPGGSNPGGNNPGRGNRDGREREKKPQTMLTPSTTPAVTPRTIPSRTTERLTPSNPVRPNVTIPQPQPKVQPQPQPRPVTRPEPAPAVRVAPQPRVQQPANNPAPSRSDGRGDDNRSRDRDRIKDKR